MVGEQEQEKGKGKGLDRNLSAKFLSRKARSPSNGAQGGEKPLGGVAAEFARLDSYINQLNSEANALASMINAFSKASEE